MMQLRNRDLLENYESTPDRRANASQTDSQLENGSGFGRVGVHRPNINTSFGYFFGADSSPCFGAVSLSHFVDVTRVGRAQRVKIALKNTELLKQVTELSLQLLHLIAMPDTALLRGSARRFWCTWDIGYCRDDDNRMNVDRTFRELRAMSLKRHGKGQSATRFSARKSMNVRTR
jgi:hypothetical protein